MTIKKVILFYGCDTQVGTTMTALSAAELLAEQGRKVICISAGSIPGTDFLDAEPAGAAVDLWGERLREEDIRFLTVEQRGVDVLQGVRSWMNCGSNLSGFLREICMTCSRSWDFVIVDGGSSGESSMGRDALDFAEKIFLVITQQEKSLRRWKMRKEWMESRMQTEPYFVVNKFMNNGTFYMESQLQKLFFCDSTRLKTVPYMPYGWQAEMERCTLLKYRSFRKAMAAISAIIEREVENELESSEG